MMINDRAKVQQKGAINGHLLTAWLVLIIFASSLIGQAQTLEAYDGKTIAQVRIVIEGATNGGQGEEFRGLLLLHAGAPYSVVQARASLLSLFNSGRAANARIEAEFDNQGAVIVTFVITPQARIGNIEFTGLTDELRPEDIRGRLEGLERNAKYSEANVQRGAEQIYELFRDRGYYQVGVEPEITLDATAMVAKITYHITPGAVARIGRITLEGDLNIPLQELRAKMRSQEGMPFSRVQLNDDIQRLLDRYLIAGHLNAQIGPPDVAYENATNEITIRIPISAGPVFTVRVKGYEIKEQRLREILPLLREGKVDAMSLDEGARRLRSHLQEEGFFFAEVEPPRMPDPTTERAELAFEVDTKQRYRVTEIRIEGAEDFSLADVEGELRSKTESFFPIPIFSRYTRGITSEEALQHDADLIVSRLRDQGFRRARMLSVNRAVNPDNDQLTIIFEVEKGPRSYISEIAFTGNMLLTADQLLALIELRPSAPASLSQIKYEANHILEYYFQRGYALATVSTRLIELGHERVRVIYEIKEGPLVFINRVLVNEIGLRQRTHSGRVKTFLNFEPGELLKNDELARAEQDMYALGAFRQVIVRSEPLGAEGETGTIQRNVYVDLDESKSRNLIYGGGYQSDEGVRGILEISDPNIFGRLTTASLRLRASQRNLLGQLSYTDPRPFGFKTPALGALLMQRETRPAFDSNRATVLLQVERRLTDRSLLLFRYSYEDVRVTNPDEITDRRDKPVRLSRLSASYAFDKRDNPFDATTGRFHTVDFSIALRALGGNEQFIRFFTENQFYYQVPRMKGTVFVGNLRLGMARNFGRVKEQNLDELERALLPITERFFTGGSTTLRGYGFEEAGPRSDPEHPRGGNALVILNAELRRPIYRQLALVGFYDVGNVFLTVDRMKFEDLTHTVGVGLRLKTPLGPFRVDFAYLASDPLTGSGLPPETKNVPKRTQIHFSFGQAF